ncbi:MAG: complex I subunit 4 family protein [Anaerolineae bacterium]
MNSTGFPLLSLIVFLPLAGAALVLVWDKRAHAGIRAVALAVTLIVLALTLAAVALFRPAEAGMQLAEQAPWIPSLGISYRLGVDGFSLFLLPLTALLFVIAVLASWKPVGSDEAGRSAVQSYFFWLLLLETGVLGVFLALDLVLFYVFWEAMLIPMYFLIGRWGGERWAYATMKFFIYTMAGSALMLVAILAMGYFAYQNTGAWTFDWQSLRRLNLPWPAPLWLFAMFGLAFAVKVPVFPFHTWLPDAYVEAPTPVTVLLAGVLSKMGVYGFVRFGLQLFPEGLRTTGPWLAVLAIIGILYASLSALMQKDVKRVIAYSSVAHLSLVVLGVVVANAQTLAGVVMQMISHGIYVAALFLIVGMLEERRGTRLIAEFGGLWKPAPLLGVCFLIAMLGAVGLPGLNGFVGEFLILVGVFQEVRVYAVLAALGMILGAWYMLWTFQRIMQGPVEARNAGVPDMRGMDLLVVVPLLVLIIVLGVFPNLILVPAGAAVTSLAGQVISVAWLP